MKAKKGAGTFTVTGLNLGTNIAFILHTKTKRGFGVLVMCVKGKWDFNFKLF